jgi:hypothetical protein
MHSTTLQALPPGRTFRFYHGNDSVIGLKAKFSYGAGGDAALILTPTKAGLQPGDVLSADDVGNVVEAEVKIVPSTKPGTVTPGAGNIAEPAEIEVRNGGLIFVTKRQDGIKLQVDIGSGAMAKHDAAPSFEIYSEWSLSGADGETLYEHKPAPAEGESIVVEVD